MSYLFNDAQIVRKQIEALKAIYPEITEDADLLADTLEGETNLDRILAKLVDFVRDAESMKEATKARQSEIGERAKRFEQQGKSGRKIILQLMEAAQQEKITLPEATLSITKQRVSVDVTDLDALPQGFFKTERKALTAEIKTALESGNAIPGAQLVMGECGLTVRVK